MGARPDRCFRLGMSHQEGADPYYENRSEFRICTVPGFLGTPVEIAVFQFVCLPVCLPVVLTNQENSKWPPLRFLFAFPFSLSFFLLRFYSSTLEKILQFYFILHEFNYQQVFCVLVYILHQPTSRYFLLSACSCFLLFFSLFLFSPFFCREGYKGKHRQP